MVEVPTVRRGGGNLYGLAGLVDVPVRVSRDRALTGNVRGEGVGSGPILEVGRQQARMVHADGV